MLTPAQAGGRFRPLPISLKNTPIPEVPGLLDGADLSWSIKNMAIALGKGLVLGYQCRSDGIACASCHFHAGPMQEPRTSWRRAENRPRLSPKRLNLPLAVAWAARITR